ncbi:hypothetical protein [Kutzneria sp. CA-103260]|uniref:hypothetical protein n=1 Tax=Kutzneria sp. CA-103260 TaxID=2802641 RepID=UPI001BA4C527|nr:hypothetical protein [Kutzneria sp. CA-103260]QUQ71037.1 hypothetical protein JJ691_88200 [Kutzneria sp. CA-103260]
MATMIFMRIIGLVTGLLVLLVLLAAPASASDIKPGVGDSFNGSSGVLTGNNTMLLTDLPVQLPGNGISLLGSGRGGDAD